MDDAAMEPENQKPDFTISSCDSNGQPEIIARSLPVPPTVPPLGLDTVIYSYSPPVMAEKNQRREEVRSRLLLRMGEKGTEQQRIRDRERAAPYFRERRQGQPERFVWTLERHRRLVDAVAELGGLEIATAAHVFTVMKVWEESITFRDVLSHLYRLRTIMGVKDWPFPTSALKRPFFVSKSSPGVTESGTFSSMIDGFGEMKLDSKDN